MSSSEVTLISKLAKTERDLLLPDTERELSDPLKKAKNDYEKKRLKAAGNYLTLQCTFAYRLFVVVTLWLIAVIVTIFFVGFKYRGFDLNDSVLIAFITSTTASVIGLFLLVAKWLFDNRKEQAQRVSGVSD